MDNDCLRLKFEDDEVLATWNPLDVKFTTTRLRIGSADCMRFTSYYLGRPKLPGNSLYRDYGLQGGVIRFRTNEAWIVPGSGEMHEATATSFPAVEINFVSYPDDSKADKSSPNFG
jgi:hypothetical protein